MNKFSNKKIFLIIYVFELTGYAMFVTLYNRYLCTFDTNHIHTLPLHHFLSTFYNCFWQQLHINFHVTSSVINIYDPKSHNTVLIFLKLRIHLRTLCLQTCSRTCSENLFFHQFPTNQGKMANQLRRQLRENCWRGWEI